ncbi:MAG: hypothetical protein P8Y92_07615 [Halioglobus sp.]|jgi:hypothetical protein
MKTVSISETPDGTTVTVELTEFELTALVALVEEGRKRLTGSRETALIQAQLGLVADEFTRLLGHLELLQTEN